MKTRAITTIPAIVMRDDAHALVRRTAGDEGQKQQGAPSSGRGFPQAAREKVSRTAIAISSRRSEAQRGIRKAAIQHALQGEHRRQDQKRAEHVSIVEGRMRAAVHEEQIGDRAEQAEVGKDRDDG